MYNQVSATSAETRVDAAGHRLSASQPVVRTRSEPRRLASDSLRLSVAALPSWFQPVVDRPKERERERPQPLVGALGNGDQVEPVLADPRRRGDGGRFAADRVSVRFYPRIREDTSVEPNKGTRRSPKKRRHFRTITWSLIPLRVAYRRLDDSIEHWAPSIAALIAGNIHYGNDVFRV